MDRLHQHLTSGSSYLTENSADPAAEGEILYRNMTAIAGRLFGENYTDDDMEIIINRVGDGTIETAYDADCDTEAAAQAIDARAKRNGWTGWL
jgi:hypothetical protein